MRFGWRTESKPLPSHAAWLRRLDKKNQESGTSAPTLAVAWSGPVELLGVLETVDALGGLVLHEAAVEARAEFDGYGGNVRNHDLVLRGTTARGESAVVCVEAKAGEPLGGTVRDHLRWASEAKAKKPNSKQLARLEDLVARFCPHPIDDDRVAKLRYQLLTAWAGTLADSVGVDHAVFVLHEFRTNERPDDKSVANGKELAEFGVVVLGRDLPDATTIPWCVKVRDGNPSEAALYVAHVVTDLRYEALVAARTA